MAFSLVYPPSGLGRGSFVTGAKEGGTLNPQGSRVGSYYRSSTDPNHKAPGLIGYLAVKYGMSCNINDYAVHRAVLGYQPFFLAKADGVLGPITNQLIRNYQTKNNLIVDGVLGPKTSRDLLEPLVSTAVNNLHTTYSAWLYTVVMGTIGHESGFDLGAIGVSTPRDRGVAQISEPGHPSISVNDCFRPSFAIPWMVDFIHDNLRAMNYDEDAAIIAYNLGIGGAWAWIAAGRPQWFRGTNTWGYIATVKKG